METSNASVGQLATTSKTFARRLLTVGDNRLELFAVEIQEERERLLRVFLLALGAVACGLLACLALTAALVIALWAWSPVIVLLTLTGLYVVAAAALYYWLTGVLRHWHSFSASLDQIRKDRACLEQILS